MRAYGKGAINRSHLCAFFLFLISSRSWLLMLYHQQIVAGHPSYPTKGKCMSCVMFLVVAPCSMVQLAMLALLTYKPLGDAGAQIYVKHATIFVPSIKSMHLALINLLLDYI